MTPACLRAPPHRGLLSKAALPSLLPPRATRQSLSRTQRQSRETEKARCEGRKPGSRRKSKKASAPFSRQSPGAGSQRGRRRAPRSHGGRSGERCRQRGRGESRGSTPGSPARAGPPVSASTGTGSAAPAGRGPDLARERQGNPMGEAVAPERRDSPCTRDAQTGAHLTRETATRATGN